jgi:hypothetical protein
MKILFDQGTPVPLRKSLSGHSVSTAYELGWDQTANGALLGGCSERVIRLVVTTDNNCGHEQNLTKTRIAILVLPTQAGQRSSYI